MIFISCSIRLFAQQSISFQRLTTANGLSYIGVNDMCVDKRGNLWIATGNGLNMFNGKTTDKYFAEEYPQLQSNILTGIACDSSNNIWIMAQGGLMAVLDEKRLFHKVTIYEENKPVRPIKLMLNKEGAIVLYTVKGNYTFKTNSISSKSDSLTKNDFNFLPIIDSDKYKLKGSGDVFNYDGNDYLLLYREAFLKINFKTNTVERKYNFLNCTALSRWNENELLVYDRLEKTAKSINLQTEVVTYPFEGMKDQYGNDVITEITTAQKINSTQYILGTRVSGIYLYNTETGKIYWYTHQITDPNSIGSNTISSILIGKKGWVFIHNPPTAISYFNAGSFINNQYVFADSQGKTYDGLIAGTATKDNITYYLGTQYGMLQWNRTNNETSFINLIEKGGESVFKEQEATSIIIDRNRHIWSTTIGNGVVVMDNNRKLLRHIRNDSGNKKSLKQYRVARVVEGPDGFIWACGRNGLSRINPDNFEIDNFENSPLAYFDSLAVVPLLFTDKDNLWISASFNGLFHYNFGTKKLEEVEAYKPFKAEGILDLKADKEGNIYVANRAGMKIIFKDGRVKIITKKDGLIFERAEALLPDSHNRMWIGNDIGLACYNPADSSLRAFDVRYGLSIYGFRLGSYYQAPNGEFVFGTPRGIQYFNPDSLYHSVISINALIHKIETKKISSNVTRSETFYLKSGDNQITFNFSSVDFSQHLTTFYRYKLAELDKEWIKLTDQNSVRYNSLPPGKYVFKLQVSHDNNTWQDADNEVTIIIAKAIYQQTWFKVLGVLVGLFLILYVIRFYRKKQELQKQELITKQKLTESRLQSLRLQMNPHFLFNALNSIQQMILANEDVVATKYLSRFSKLLRTVLTHSDKESVSLKEEIEILKMYVELEAVRFKETFTYTIDSDEGIETDEIKIPTLLIQPFVENAIWHGLMHKEGNRHLSVVFTEKQDYLQCIIEDNGIGRRKAGEIKASSGTDKHTSKGISVSEERLKTLTNRLGMHGNIVIDDLMNESGEAAGTQVVLNFPI